MTDLKNIPKSSFRGKKEQIIDFKNKHINGIEICSSIQERIIFSNKRINTVYGCAGSRKTDTLCKYGFRQFGEGKNILFLTLISSVTHEIKTRVEKMFKIRLDKYSNHYYNKEKKNQATVEVTTFDAFISRQLEPAIKSASVYSDDSSMLNDSTYKQRMNKLANSDHDKFIMKNGNLASTILIDEFQDLEPDKIKIIINILKRNSEVNCMVIGDYLQTIFERSIVIDDVPVEHPFEFWRNSFINEESYEDFEINVCYRCPKPQIDFVNHIMDDTMPRKLYQILPMDSPNYQNLEVQSVQDLALGNASRELLHNGFCSDDSKIKIETKNNETTQKNAIIQNLERTQQFTDNKTADVHKPFIFIHSDMGYNGNENTNGDYIARQTLQIINTIIENDKSEKLNYSDVTILMLKSNNQAVFKQLENLMNANSDSRGKIQIYETKGDGYHQTIDWNKSEGKMSALSIHGYKGRGNKIIVLLGLNNMILPRKENINTSKELIDYSLLNVGLSRSQKYLVIGVTTSAPTKYFYDKRTTFEDYCYCSWKSDQLMPLVYKKIQANLRTSKWNMEIGKLTRCPISKFKHKCNERCKLRLDELYFDTWFYKPGKIYPKHINSTVTDNICEVIDNPEELLTDYAQLQKEITPFGKQINIDCKMDDYEKKILGVAVEWIVNRYLYLNGDENRLDFLKYIAFMLDKNKSKVYFTNDETLLNIIADKCINAFAIHHIYDEDDRKSAKIDQIWKSLFDSIREDHESLLYKDKTGIVNKINELSSGLPKLIVHSNFNNEQFKEQLIVLHNLNIKNENIDSKIFWNFGLFQMLLFEKVRTPYLSSYYGRMNYDLDSVCVNVEIFCRQLLNYKRPLKQLSHKIELTVEERVLFPESKLKSRVKKIKASDIYEDEGVASKKCKPFTISGKSDLYIPEANKIIEIKASTFTEISNAWIVQALSYCCIPLNHMLNDQEYIFEPKRIQIVNLLFGITYNLELPRDFNPARCMEKIMKKLKWPQEIIDKYFE